MVTPIGAFGLIVAEDALDKVLREMGGVAHDESRVSFRVPHRLQSGAHALQYGHGPVAVAPGRPTIELETERKLNGSAFLVPGSRFKLTLNPNIDATPNPELGTRNLELRYSIDALSLP